MTAADADVTHILFYYGFVFILTICFVVFIHELGHFLMARLFGVRVTKFSVGFGTELCGFTDRRGTRWCVSAIPLGGYVGIYGDVDRDNPLVWDEEQKAARRMTEAEFSQAFCSKPVWQRSLIVLAGPVINFILTFVVMISVYSAMGQQYTQPVIYAVGVGSAADAAGFELGDRITAMDGKPIEDISKIYDQTYEQPGREFVFDVLRGEEKLKLKLTPKEIVYTDTKGVDRKHGRTGMVSFSTIKLKDFSSVDGVDTKGHPEIAAEVLKKVVDKKIVITMAFRQGEEDPFEIIIPSKFNKELLEGSDFQGDFLINVNDVERKFFRKLSVFEAAQTSFKQIAHGLQESYLIVSAVFNSKSNERVVSGVGSVSKNIGDAAKHGIHSYLLMLAMISFMIGFINIMPIPVFDGGYLVFFLIEAIRGKPLSQKIQSRAMIFGLVLIGGIMVFANVSDLFHLFG